MVLLTIHRFTLRHKGKDYQPGDTVEMEEDKAKELAEKYGSAFSYEAIEAEIEVEAETEVEAEEVQEAVELPVPDVAEVVVKPRKRTSRKK